MEKNNGIESLVQSYVKEVAELKNEVSDLGDIVRGNPHRTIQGLIHRQDMLEKRGDAILETLEEFQRDNEGRRNVMNGVKIGLGLTGVGTALNMILQVFLQ